MLDSDSEYPTDDTLNTLIQHLTKRNREHCDDCGGILPELVIASEDYFFTLTCIQVWKKGKVIDETNYEKLKEHLEALEKVKKTEESSH